jgi:hypothetical protein
VAVAVSQSDQLKSVAVDDANHSGTSLVRRLQAKGFSLNKRKRSNDFVSRGNVLEDYVTMISNKQEHNNESGNDICGRTGELIDCQFCEKFVSCVKLTLLHKVTEALRCVNELDGSSRYFEAFSGSVTSERNVGSELGAFDVWREGDIIEGHAIQALLVSGITELFHNRSLIFRFVPGITVNILTKKMGPGLLNLSVKLVHDGERVGNHFLESGKVVRVLSAPVAFRTILWEVCNVWKYF